MSNYDDDVIILKIGDDRERVLHIGKLFIIDEANLSDEFSNQAAHYAYYATVAADAAKEESVASSRKDYVYAAVDEDVRREWDEEGVKYTEPKVRAEVLLCEDYQQAVHAENVARHNVQTLRAVVDALRMRAEMLISLGAHVRKEMDMTNMQMKQSLFDDKITTAKEAIHRMRGQQV